MPREIRRGLGRRPPILRRRFTRQLTRVGRAFCRIYPALVVPGAASSKRGGTAMAQAAIRDRDEAAAAIDRAHLTRMTFGEAALERELLELFDRQAELLIARIAQSDPATVAALAHTLKGSAVGVGASEVAAAAAAVARARAEIAVILR